MNGHAAPGTKLFGPKPVLTCSVLALVSACVANPKQPGGQDRPMAFHDTRLQYALLTHDSDMLERQFRMRPHPSIAERAIAGFVLPVTAATETAFFPLYSSMQIFHGANRQP